DDIAALRQYSSSTSTDALLVKPATAIRGVTTASVGYWLKTQPKTLTLEILDSKGQVVRTFSGTPPQTPPADANAAAGGDDGPPRPAASVPMATGLNRFS